MDERLLTDEKCEVLFNSKYDGDITFAFDNIADYDLIHKKLQMIRKYTERQVMFYVLVGFESTDENDIENYEFYNVTYEELFAGEPYVPDEPDTPDEPAVNPGFLSIVREIRGAVSDFFLSIFDRITGMLGC